MIDVAIKVIEPVGKFFLKLYRDYRDVSREIDKHRRH